MDDFVNIKQEIIDPFSVPNNNRTKKSEKTVQEGMEENVGILYVTGGIIIALVIIWIIMVIFTHESSIGVLDEMIKSDTQTPLILDDKNEENKIVK